MKKEIGSNFWLNPNEEYHDIPIGTPDIFNCNGSDNAWFSTGRSAISFVIEEIESKTKNLRKVAILPSFTCETVFNPFLKSGYDVYYYPIKMDLTASSDVI